MTTPPRQPAGTADSRLERGGAPTPVGHPGNLGSAVSGSRALPLPPQQIVKPRGFCESCMGVIVSRTTRGIDRCEWTPCVCGPLGSRIFP